MDKAEARSQITAYWKNQGPVPIQAIQEYPFIGITAANQNMFQVLPVERFAELPFIWEKPVCHAVREESGDTVYHYGAKRGFLKFCPRSRLSLEIMEGTSSWWETPFMLTAGYRTMDQVPLELIQAHLDEGGPLAHDAAMAGNLAQFPSKLLTPGIVARRCPRSGMNLAQAAAKGRCIRVLFELGLADNALLAQVGQCEASAYQYAGESGCLDQFPEATKTFEAFAEFNSFYQNTAQIAAMAGNLNQIPARHLPELLHLSCPAPDPQRQRYVSVTPIHGFGGNLGHCAAVGRQLDRFPRTLQSNQVFDEANAEGNLVMHLAAMHECLHQINPHWITSDRLVSRNGRNHSVLQLCSERDLEFLLTIPELDARCQPHVPSEWWKSYQSIHLQPQALNQNQDIAEVDIF